MTISGKIRRALIRTLDSAKATIIDPIKENVIEPIKENVIEPIKENVIEPLRDTLGLNKDENKKEEEKTEK